MELNIWTTTNVTKAVWNESAKNWIVNLERERDGSKNTCMSNLLSPLTMSSTHLLADTLHPRHVVLATGASGKPTVPSIPGMNAFKGSRLIHSSEFDGFPPEPVDVGHGKSILVVGSCNSGHDIAQDYYEHGYKVTIVQRSSTLVVGSETLVDVTMAGLYCDNGVRVTLFVDCSRVSFCKACDEEAAYNIYCFFGSSSIFPPKIKC